MKNEDFSWPLMSNNITRKDLSLLIDYLSQENPRLTHGPQVVEFERQWSEWLGVNDSVMVNSGASANDITLLALRELHGTGEVIVPALTWVSDVASVIAAGFKPIFVDVDPLSFGMNSRQVLNRIGKNTKAIFLTHILGFDAFDDDLISIVNDESILVIEDVCESHGARHSNKRLGSIGFASNFSFYFAHHMSTIEGGMISSSDSEFIDICRMMRSHGLVRESRNVELKQKLISAHADLNPEFIFQYAAHNMRPTELNAVLGISQLSRLDENIAKRNSNFLQFLSILDPEKFQTNFKLKGMSNYALTLVMKNSDLRLRNKIEEALNHFRVEFRRGLSGGGNQMRQPYVKKLLGDQNLIDMSVVEHLHNYSWYLGNYPDLPDRNFEVLSDLMNHL